MRQRIRRAEPVESCVESKVEGNRVMGRERGRKHRLRLQPLQDHTREAKWSQNFWQDWGILPGWETHCENGAEEEITPSESGLKQRGHLMRWTCCDFQWSRSGERRIATVPLGSEMCSGTLDNKISKTYFHTSLNWDGFKGTARLSVSGSQESLPAWPFFGTCLTPQASKISTLAGLHLAQAFCVYEE